MRRRKRFDLTGRKFGKLFATGKIKRRYGQIYHQCYCDCGNTNWVQTGHLINNRTTNCGCAKKLEPGMACRNSLLHQYKIQAKKRNLVWRLTNNQFYNIVNKRCYFCKQKNVNEIKKFQANGSFKYNGIDRYDNSKGYIFENCVPCCKFCNRAKGSGSVKEFKKWLRGINLKG